MRFPTPRWTTYYRLLLGEDRRRRRPPARRQARARSARSPPASTATRPPRQAEAALRPPACRARPARRHRGPRRSPPDNGTVHLPALIARALRRLPLGGPPPDRAGRRGLDGEPLGAAELDLAPSASTARSSRSASGASRGCAVVEDAVPVLHCSVALGRPESPPPGRTVFENSAVRATQRSCPGSTPGPEASPRAEARGLNRTRRVRLARGVRGGSRARLDSSSI